MCGWGGVAAAVPAAPPAHRRTAAGLPTPRRDHTHAHAHAHAHHNGGLERERERGHVSTRLTRDHGCILVVLLVVVVVAVVVVVVVVVMVVVRLLGGETQAVAMQAGLGHARTRRVHTLRPCGPCPSHTPTTLVAFTAPLPPRRWCAGAADRCAAPCAPPCAAACGGRRRCARACSSASPAANRTRFWRSRSPPPPSAPPCFGIAWQRCPGCVSRRAAGGGSSGWGASGGPVEGRRVSWSWSCCRMWTRPRIARSGGCPQVVVEEGWRAAWGTRVNVNTTWMWMWMWAPTRAVPLVAVLVVWVTCGLRVWVWVSPLALVAAAVLVLPPRHPPALLLSVAQPQPQVAVWAWVWVWVWVWVGMTVVMALPAPHPPLLMVIQVLALVTDGTTSHKMCLRGHQGGLCRRETHRRVTPSTLRCRHSKVRSALAALAMRTWMCAFRCGFDIHGGTLSPAPTSLQSWRGCLGGWLPSFVFCFFVFLH